MSGEPDSPDVQMVKAATIALGEHFDTVQIFVTRHEAGSHDGTKHVTFGSGNWFARFGQIKSWLIAVDEDTRLLAAKTRE